MMSKQAKQTEAREGFVEVLIGGNLGGQNVDRRLQRDLFDNCAIRRDLCAQLQNSK